MNDTSLLDKDAYIAMSLMNSKITELHKDIKNSVMAYAKVLQPKTYVNSVSLKNTLTRAPNHNGKLQNMDSEKMTEKQNLTGKMIKQNCLTLFEKFSSKKG
jgi:hypothetical protein